MVLLLNEAHTLLCSPQQAGATTAAAAHEAVRNRDDPNKFHSQVSSRIINFRYRSHPPPVYPKHPLLLPQLPWQRCMNQVHPAAAVHRCCRRSASVLPARQRRGQQELAETAGTDHAAARACCCCCCCDCNQYHCLQDATQLAGTACRTPAVPVCAAAEVTAVTAVSTAAAAAATKSCC